MATVARPDLFLREEWAVAQSGDAVATAIVRTGRTGPRYDCVKTIAVKGAPVIQILPAGLMRIPFTKAHGAKNDFLLTWASDAPRANLPDVARAICDRHTGVGADGWLLVEPAPNGCRLPCRDPAVQCRRQRGRDLGQRHALRGGVPDRQRSGARPDVRIRTGRGREAPASDRAERTSLFSFEMEWAAAA